MHVVFHLLYYCYYFYWINFVCCLEEYDSIKDLLVEIAPRGNSSLVNNWNTGGQVYLDYIKLCEEFVDIKVSVWGYVYTLILFGPISHPNVCDLVRSLVHDILYCAIASACVLLLWQDHMRHNEMLIAVCMYTQLKLLRKEIWLGMLIQLQIYIVYNNQISSRKYDLEEVHCF